MSVGFFSPLWDVAESRDGTIPWSEDYTFWLVASRRAVVRDFYATPSSRDIRGMLNAGCEL